MFQELFQVKFNRIESPDWRGISRMGGLAALVQLACCMITMIVLFTIGGEPGSAQEYFTLLQSNRLIGLMRMDFPSMLLVALYPLTLFGLYASLREARGAILMVAIVLGVSGVAMWLANHSAFSMISLANKYALATAELQRSQLLAAGEAVIASDMYHSTGAFMCGIFLQGATTWISVLMLKAGVFNKAAAWVGITAHGLDLLHVLFMPVFPAAAVPLMIVSGPLYPIWFWMIGRRLLQLGKDRLIEDRSGREK